MSGRWPRSSGSVVADRRRPHPDPDPIRAPGTDDIFPTAQYVEGYDAGFHDAEHLRPSQALVKATAFAFGILVGLAGGVVLFLGAAGVR